MVDIDMVQAPSSCSTILFNHTYTWT